MKELKMIKMIDGNAYQHTVSFPESCSLQDFREQFCKANKINKFDFNNAMLGGLALHFSGKVLKKTKPTALDYLATLGSDEKRLDFLKASQELQESLVEKFAETNRLVKTSAVKVDDKVASEVKSLWLKAKQEISKSIS